MQPLTAFRAAEADSKCKRAWALKEKCRVNPNLRKNKRKQKTGRKANFTYAKHYCQDIVYACARYPAVFRSWLVRVRLFETNPDFVNKGLSPSCSTINRRLEEMRATHPEGWWF